MERSTESPGRMIISEQVTSGFEVVGDGRGHKRWECRECGAHGAWSMYSDHAWNARYHQRKRHNRTETLQLGGQVSVKLVNSVA